MSGARTVTARNCTECGRLPRGPAVVSLNGELTCTHHPVRDRCFTCGRPRCSGGTGWEPAAPGMLRCPTCSSEAVLTQVDARRFIPRLRRDLAGMGIALAARVRVRLVPLGDLDSSGSTTLLGLTEQRWYDGDAARRSVEIRVAAGLPPTHFGRVVAHEVGHAWLGERGAWVADQRIEEGVCEVFAAAWLKRRRTSLADSLREQIRRNPDPTYGGGYRLVHEAVVRRGISAVLDSICRTGRPG